MKKYIITTGAQNKLFTLRTNPAASKTGWAQFIMTLTGDLETSKEKLVQKGYNLNDVEVVSQSVDAYAEKNEIDHSILWFGNKHNGKALVKIAEEDPQYLVWLITKNVLSATKFAKTVSILSELATSNENLVKALAEAEAKNQAYAAKKAGWQKEKQELANLIVNNSGFVGEVGTRLKGVEVKMLGVYQSDRPIYHSYSGGFETCFNLEMVTKQGDLINATVASVPEFCVKESVWIIDGSVKKQDVVSKGVKVGAKRTRLMRVKLVQLVKHAPDLFNNMVS